MVFVMAPRMAWCSSWFCMHTHPPPRLNWLVMRLMSPMHTQGATESATELRPLPRSRLPVCAPPLPDPYPAPVPLFPCATGVSPATPHLEWSCVSFHSQFAVVTLATTPLSLSSAGITTMRCTRSSPAGWYSR